MKKYRREFRSYDRLQTNSKVEIRIDWPTCLL
nr:MAG TPA: hypothetical protein [Caudoviricetes sp.]